MKSTGLFGRIPNEKNTIKTRCRITSTTPLNAVDSILVLGGELSLSCGFCSVDLVLEDLHSRSLLVSSSGRCSRHSVQLLDQLPSSLVLEQDRSTVVSDGNNSGFVDEDDVHKRQILGLHFRHSRLSRRDIGNVERGIVSNVSKEVARRAPLDGLDPPATLNLHERFSKDELVAKRSVGDSLVNSLNVGSKNADLEVTRGSGKESTAGVPIDLEDSGFVLLNVLGDPPVVVLLEVADRDALGTTAHCKLVLIRAPLDVSGGSVYSENNESWLPLVVLEGPDVGVTILRARHDAVGLGSPVDSRHDLVMLGQFVFQLEGSSLFGVDMDLVVIGAESDLCSVSIPGVAGN